MTKRHGYALLAAVAALVVVISAAIYLGVSGAFDGSDSTVSAGPRHPQNSAAPASTGTWSGSWSASPAGGEPGTETDGLAGRTVRNVVHTSIGGTSARITFSNLFGQQPLSITHASVAVAAAPNTPPLRPGCW
ncbi:SGNH/GDSL hydrolase family protein, partial [Streptomyces sp. NPDC000188]